MRSPCSCFVVRQWIAFVVGVQPPVTEFSPPLEQLLGDTNVYQRAGVEELGCSGKALCEDICTHSRSADSSQFQQSTLEALMKPGYADPMRSMKIARRWVLTGANNSAHGFVVA